MDRASFLRWLGVAVASGLWLQGRPPALATGLHPAAMREVPPAAVDALAAADRAVDAAYRACAEGGWAPALQRRYLRAAMDAARAWRTHAPWDEGGQDHLRLAVDLATDVGWDPREARAADRALMREAAQYTQARPNSDMHPSRARALLARLDGLR